MRFKNYDNLRLFNIVAKHGSFSAAADELNLTKGAVSYQIKKLEAELGFEIFQRLPRGITLTSKGQELRHTCQGAFDNIEQKVSELRETNEQTLTIGVSTYFASRWLSSRLMLFLNSHPTIRLRIQLLRYFCMKVVLCAVHIHAQTPAKVHQLQLWSETKCRRKKSPKMYKLSST